MLCAGTPHRPGSQWALQPSDGAEIFHRQRVVGACQQRRLLCSQQGGQRRLPPGGKGAPVLRQRCQGHGKIRALQALRRTAQSRQIAALRAEHQLRYHAGARQDVHAALREPLRRGHGPHRGQLQHQIGAAAHRHLRPGQLVRHGKAAPLGEAAAHGADHRLRPAPSRLLHQIGVAGVERIKFTNNACNGHSCSPPSSFFRLFYHEIPAYCNAPLDFSPPGSLQ